MNRVALRSDSKLYGKVALAILDYINGCSCHDLAVKYKVNHANMYRTLVKFGCPMRTQKEGIARCLVMGRWPDRSGQKASRWNGGRSAHSEGYQLVNHPGHIRADARGYVFEHVLVAEEMLGRPLRDDEIAHHKNRIRSDNRPENIEVMDVCEHRRMHGLEGAAARWKKPVSVPVKKGE